MPHLDMPRNILRRPVPHACRLSAGLNRLCAVYHADSTSAARDIIAGAALQIQVSPPYTPVTPVYAAYTGSKNGPLRGLDAVEYHRLYFRIVAAVCDLSG